MRAKSISREFFASVAAVVLLVRALVRRKRSGRYGGYRRRRFFK